VAGKYILALDQGTTSSRASSLTGGAGSSALPPRSSNRSIHSPAG